MNLKRFNTIPPLRSFVNRFFSMSFAVAILTMPLGLVAGQAGSATMRQKEIVAVDTRIEKTDVKVAERIQMEITATTPDGVTVKFPELENRLGDFIVVGFKDILDIPDGSNRKWIRKIGLESLISGELEIPATELSYVDRRGSQPVTGFQEIPAQIVTIRSALEGVEDPTQFRDIKSVVFLPEPEIQNRQWLAWAAGIAGLCFVVATVFCLVVRRKPSLSATQWALQALDELKASRPMQEMDAEQIYVRLTSILKSFVQKQFGIFAPRLTTAEFFNAMQADERLSVEFRTQLNELLTMADMVKFAGMLPDNSGLTTVIDEASKLVKDGAEADAQTETTHDGQISREAS